METLRWTNDQKLFLKRLEKFKINELYKEPNWAR